MTVDWELGIDVEAMRTYRLNQAREAMNDAGLAALVCFDAANLRYITSTHIGTWALDKMGRYCVLPNGGEPFLYDFGSAVKVKQMNSPWLKKDHIKPTSNWMRGAVPLEAGAVDHFAKELSSILSDHGAKGPVGFDLMDVPMIKAVEREGIEIVDGQEALLEARTIKSPDEIRALEMAATMVDGAYYEVQQAIKPGVRENELVARVNDVLFRLGSEYVECVNVVSGPRTNPHPHVFSDRIIRPGDLVFLDIMHTYLGYHTCYYRTFVCGESTKQQEDVYRRTVEWLDASIEVLRPGITTADIAEMWPGVEDFGFGDFQNEADAFALQFGHGIGLSLWEKPVVSRLFMETPYEIREGMVFALETYCGSKDGKDGARIEDEVVITRDGYRIITKFPRDELISCW